MLLTITLLTFDTEWRKFQNSLTLVCAWVVLLKETDKIGLVERNQTMVLTI